MESSGGFSDSTSLTNVTTPTLRHASTEQNDIPQNQNPFATKAPLTNKSMNTYGILRGDSMSASGQMNTVHGTKREAAVEDEEYPQNKRQRKIETVAPLSSIHSSHLSSQLRMLNQSKSQSEMKFLPVMVEKVQYVVFKPLNIAGQQSGPYSPIKYPPIGCPSSIENDSILYRVRRLQGYSFKSVEINSTIIEDIQILTKWYIHKLSPEFRSLFITSDGKHYDFPIVTRVLYAEEAFICLKFRTSKQAALFLTYFRFRDVKQRSGESIEPFEPYFIQFFKHGRCHSKEYLSFLMSPEQSSMGLRKADIPLQKYIQAIEGLLRFYKDIKMVGAWLLIPNDHIGDSKEVLFTVLIPKTFDVKQAKIPGFINEEDIFKTAISDHHRKSLQWFRILFEHRLSYCRLCYDEVHETNENCPRFRQLRCFKCNGIGHFRAQCNQ